MTVGASLDTLALAPEQASGELMRAIQVARRAVARSPRPARELSATRARSVSRDQPQTFDAARRGGARPSRLDAPFP